MGYMVDGYGYVYPQNGVSAKELSNRLEDVFEDFLEYGVTEMRKERVFEFSFFGNYFEDETEETLNGIAPYIHGGYVEFCDDTHNHWRYVFNGKTKEWEYELGEVVYSSDRDSVWVVVKTDPYEMVGVYATEDLARQAQKTASLSDHKATAFEIREEKVNHG